jgi:hypothetical protein
MSEIRVNKLINEAGTGAVELTQGATIPSGKTLAGSGSIDSGLIPTLNQSTTGTSAGLTGTPDITVNNIVGAAVTFSGNVSIGGTLTYQDVTNVDSVGVITARSGLHLTGVYKENITAMGALEVDCSSGNYFTKTINGNSAFTFANVPSSGAYSFTLELTHTSGTVSWPASVKWPSDTAPSLTTGKTHLFMFLTDDGGTRFRGSSLVDYVN